MSTSPLRILIEGNRNDVAAALGPGAEFVDAAPCDVALQSVDEIDDAALEAVPMLRDRAGAPVIVVVAELPIPRRGRALAAAADGVLERGQLSRTLMPAIEAVRAGLVVVPPAMYRALERPPLSNREKQILAMVVLGCSNAEIATKLVVTESTVKNHLSSAFAKLGVRSRSAATSLVLDPATGLGLGVLHLSGDADT